MADTTKVKMSKKWVKISDGDCTVQANSNEQFQFSISATTPTPTTDAGLFLRISEPVTLAYKTAVWCRLPASYVRNDTIAISIVRHGFDDNFDPMTIFAGGEQGAWYDPSDKSTLYQDVAGTVPVTKDGDPVALMRDKSGNDNHAVQSVSTSRPVYKTDGILHWLAFDGVDDSFDILSMDFLGGNIVSSASIRPMATTQSNKTLLSQYGSRKSLLWYFSTNAVKLYTISGEKSQVASVPNGKDLVVGARNTQAGDYKGCRVDGIPLGASVSFDAMTSSAPATAMLGSAEGYAQRFGGRLYGIVAAFNDGAVAHIGAMDLYMANKAGVTL